MTHHTEPHSEMHTILTTTGVLLQLELPPCTLTSRKTKTAQEGGKGQKPHLHNTTITDNRLPFLLQIKSAFFFFFLRLLYSSIYHVLICLTEWSCSTQWKFFGGEIEQRGSNQEPKQKTSFNWQDTTTDATKQSLLQHTKCGCDVFRTSYSTIPDPVLWGRSSCQHIFLHVTDKRGWGCLVPYNCMGYCTI